MEVNKIGNIYGFDGGNYAGNVYDPENIAPTLRSHSGGNTEPIIIAETKCVNSKGGRAGIENIQPSIQDRVYSIDGISTSITTSYMPSILEDRTIVSMRGKTLIPDNPSDRTVCNTLTSVKKDNIVLEKIVAVDEQNMCIREDTVGTLMTDGSSPKHNNRIAELTESDYRIRKLTPLEVWRLMGFSDEDFHKAEAENSNSQLYKQAGNSIVVDVLYYIFIELYKAMPYLFDDLKLSSFFSGIGAFETALDRVYEDVNAGRMENKCYA